MRSHDFALGIFALGILGSGADRCFLTLSRKCRTRLHNTKKHTAGTGPLAPQGA